MALHKYHQVIDISREDDIRVVRSFRTENEAAEFCNSHETYDYMGWMLLTIRPVWSNASEAGVKILVGES